MRVIAGTFRSRLLVAPKGTGTRPTSDRLRERLFSILAPRLEGCRFADLYAGTGAVGIEAISRGAAHVWFAEKADPALAAIRDNLKALKIARGFTLEDRGTGALLERLVKLAHKAPDAPPAPRPADLLDIVYLDPPWEARPNTPPPCISSAAPAACASSPPGRWSSPNTTASPNSPRASANSPRPAPSGRAMPASASTPPPAHNPTSRQQTRRPYAPRCAGRP